jgi:hypothetical protein
MADIQPTRRTLISQAAGVIAVNAVTLPAAVAGTDPAFALIEAHRKTEAAYIRSFDYLAENDPVSLKLKDDLCYETDDLAWDIARCQPTTLAGCIAVLRYTADDPENARWPADGERLDERRSTLQKNLASALERIGGSDDQR